MVAIAVKRHQKYYHHDSSIISEFWRSVSSAGASICSLYKLSRILRTVFAFQQVSQGLDLNINSLRSMFLLRLQRIPTTVFKFPNHLQSILIKKGRLGQSRQLSRVYQPANFSEHQINFIL